MIDLMLQHPIAERLGWVLIHSLWQGAAIAALLLIAMRYAPASKHAMRHGLATVALLTWLSLPAITWFQYAPNPNTTIEPHPITHTDALSASMGNSVLSPTGQTATADNTHPPAGEGKTNTQSMARWQALLPYAGIGWLAAATLLLLRLLGGYFVVQQLRRTGQPLHNLTATLSDLAARLGLKRQVRIALSDRIDSPSALGFLRPMILIPASAVTGLSTSQLELILAHELAHIQRNDYLVNLLQGLAEALFFYHPLTWMLSRILNAEREHACDETALTITGAQRIDLAESLASLENTRPTIRPALSASTLLTHRIRRLLQPTNRSPGMRASISPLIPLAALSMWFAFADNGPTTETQRIIVLDAGHSQTFPGATGSGIKEADLVLAVTLKTKDLLIAQGIDVRLTRSNEDALGDTLTEDLDARAQLATPDVDAFISIHAGAATSPTVTGIDASIAAENAQPDTATFNSSTNLAGAVVNHVMTTTGANLRRETMPAAFTWPPNMRFNLLANIKVPGMMLEIGYLTNPEEAATLALPEYQTKVAEGIAAGIMEYLNNLSEGANN